MMGNWESGHQAIKPPETPEYVKYSHLKELVDPRSPQEGRTPVLALSEAFKLMDPRSPVVEFNRTPVYKIPEPSTELNLRQKLFVKAYGRLETESELSVTVSDDIFNESADSLVLDIQQVQQSNDQELNMDLKQVEEEPQELKDPSKEEPTSASDKYQILENDKRTDNGNSDNVDNVQNKESLSSKSTSKTKSDKTTRKVKNKIISGFVIPKEKQFSDRPMTDQKKTFKAKQIYSHAVSRSPLTSRNFDILREEHSPSVQNLLLKTQALSISNRKPRNINKVLDMEAELLGKENYGATFSPS